MNNSETEQKIKEAARKVFRSKGFDAARTRDIAEMAGVNLALINYYYKTKEALFEEILEESLSNFRDVISNVLNDETSSVQEKITKITDSYFEKFFHEPDLPLFIFQGVQNDREFLVKKINPELLIHNSFFEKQLMEQGRKREDVEQIFLNMVSLIIFPFIGNSVFKNVCCIDSNEYQQLLKMRKKKIPKWIMTMFNL
ncbi:MAG: TetR/AcrR family transcriptional regulator [Bacteroidales bacterium]|nr:TetR/AcrR family transcriptional regulator [Bacteroidales bacterium]